MPTNILFDFRNQINSIDEKIVQLLAKRKKIVLQIANSKIENNQEIRDIEREEKILGKLVALGKKHNLESDYITQLFQLIIKESVLTQEKILQNFYSTRKINASYFSILGPKGSYSHIAASKYAERNFKICLIKEYSTFQEVLKSVENKESNYAVLPIENTCSGYINEIFDLLKNTKLFIIGDINILINHCLVSIKKIQLNEIQTIYSHPQPFQQCSEFIKKFPTWKIKYTKSTADAMKKISQYNKISNAALGSEIGSKIYGLNILLKNLANQEKNLTRFIVLKRKPIETSQTISAITTLIFTTGQESGSLAKVLFILKETKIIINKLTSYNTNKYPWEEMFYIDIQANLSSKIIQNTIKKITKITKFLKILGCYPSEKIIQ